MNYASTKNAFLELIRPESLYLKVISLCLLMQMLNWGEAYRTLAYLNLAIVSIYAYRAVVFRSDIEIKKALIWVLAIPVVFLALHSISILEFEFVKEIRHTIIAVFLTFGIYVLARENSAYIKQSISFHLAVLVFSYILIQLVAITLFDKPNGTTKNPHYLALYSSMTLVFCVYSFFNSSFRLKIFFAFAILLLGFFLLQTGSRPGWLGVILSGGLALLFLKGSARKISALIFPLILAVLFITNAGDFSEKVSDLALNITKEERVTIWQDTWEMQKSSTPFQWIFGHGLNSFEADFKEYSRYHLKNVDFNSPHNFLLEMIYI
ncbi:MAG: O-antigen ligase family protein, partial [Nitrosomonadales bacterium]|nr:O-antigen ligase family protein [Nitrosomonadales bacterium]